MKTEIKTTKACLPVGTYSQAIMVDGLVFISAQSPIDASNDKVIDGDAESHIRQSFKNIFSICDASNIEPNDIVKITAYLTSSEDFPKLNLVMNEFLKNLFQLEPH
ncbi:Rid family hydrolase [Vibrio sp. PP-XX7]